MNINDECIICLDQIKDYDYVILSCKHMIHYNCLETWINTKKDYVKMCPICDTPSEVENIIIVEELNKKVTPIDYLIEESYEPLCCCNIL